MQCFNPNCRCYEVAPGVHIHPPWMPQSEIDWRKYWEAKTRERERRMPKAMRKAAWNKLQGKLF
jgi:hypothetical protein